MLDRTNLGDLLPREAPDHPIFIDLRDPAGPRSWTTGEFDRAANAVARGLLRRGFRRGDRIAILSENRAEYLIAYFGTMRAGLVSAPVNFKLPKETVAYIFQDAGLTAAFSDRRILNRYNARGMKTVAERGKERWEHETLEPALAKSPERAASFSTISGRPIEQIGRASCRERV